MWLAPPAVRAHHERMRCRSDLVGVQTEMKNRIHAFFHRHAVFMLATGTSPWRRTPPQYRALEEGDSFSGILAER